MSKSNSSNKIQEGNYNCSDDNEKETKKPKVIYKRCLDCPLKPNIVAWNEKKNVWSICLQSAWVAKIICE